MGQEPDGHYKHNFPCDLRWWTKHRKDNGIELEIGDLLHDPKGEPLQTVDREIHRQNKTQSPHIFLSLTGRDDVRNTLVRPTRWFLEQELKVTAFLDEQNLAGGQSIPDVLANEASNCSHAIVFISPNYRKRRFCVLELNTFMERKRNQDGIQILPVLWDVDTMAGYHSELHKTVWISNSSRLDEINFLIRILWPGILRFLARNPRSTDRLEQDLCSYVKSARGDQLIPVTLELFYRKNYQLYEASTDGGRSTIVENKQMRSLREEACFDQVLFEVERDTELDKDDILHIAGRASTYAFSRRNKSFFSRHNDLLDAAAEEIRKDMHHNKRKSFLDYHVSLFSFIGWFARRLDSYNCFLLAYTILQVIPFASSYEAVTLSVFVTRLRLRQQNLQPILRVAKLKVLFYHALKRCHWLFHWSDVVQNTRFLYLISLLPVVGVHLSCSWTENHWLCSPLIPKLRCLIQAQCPADYLSSSDIDQVPKQNIDGSGVFVGRFKTNQFHQDCRFPVDENILRQFAVDPRSILQVFGVEHVLRCVGEHWRQMLYNENGVFLQAEGCQLDPVGALRYQLPIVLSMLLNLRGRCMWDKEVLGPKVADLENSFALDPKDPSSGLRNAQALLEFVIQNSDKICGGVKPRVQALLLWAKAIKRSLEKLRETLPMVEQLVQSAATGIQLGVLISHSVDLPTVSRKRLLGAIDIHLHQNSRSTSQKERDAAAVGRALDKLRPADKRKTIELIRSNLKSSSVARDLLARLKGFFERELYRDDIDSMIAKFSRGKTVEVSELVVDCNYYVQSGHMVGCFAYCGSNSDSGEGEGVAAPLKFAGINGVAAFFDEEADICEYIPVSEAIDRAKKVFLTIMLHYSGQFSFCALAEATCDEQLYSQFLDLMCMSQLQSYSLDMARRCTLADTKSRASLMKVSPQNVAVVGGGPTGLLVSLHSLESVLSTGGKIAIHESRGEQEIGDGASYLERAQILLLDNQCASLLRYHLGCSFEDTFISTTTPTICNTRPFQGLLEAPIRTLENRLTEEIVALRSIGLIEYHSGCKLHVNTHRGYKLLGEDGPVLSKYMGDVKVGDFITNDEGNCYVEDVGYAQSLQPKDLTIDHLYNVFQHGAQKAILCYLRGIDDRAYEFQAVHEKIHSAGFRGEVPFVFRSLFRDVSVYSEDVCPFKGKPTPVTFTVRRGEGDIVSRSTLSAPVYQYQKIPIDIPFSHVLLTTGIPFEGRFNYTKKVPYGVCVFESQAIILPKVYVHWKLGDFGQVELLRRKAIATEVSVILRGIEEQHPWLKHFCSLTSDLGLGPSILCPALRRSFTQLSSLFTDSGSKYSQARVVVLDRLLYLGMISEEELCAFSHLVLFVEGCEIPQEFVEWKTHFLQNQLPTYDILRQRLFRFSVYRQLDRQLDRLWFEATLCVIRKRLPHLPKLQTCTSFHPVPLSSLKTGDCFSLSKQSSSKFLVEEVWEKIALVMTPCGQQIKVPRRTHIKSMRDDHSVMDRADVSSGFIDFFDRFTVLCTSKHSSLVCNKEGFTFRLPTNFPVLRESDLTRRPDGVSESLVSVASFPVSMCLKAQVAQALEGERLVLPMGALLASPHFMRSSGLASACSSARSFDDFIAHGVAGISFTDRVARYVFDAHDIIDGVASRATGQNFGEDDLSRPHFCLDDMARFLVGRAIHHLENGKDVETVLSLGWKKRLSAALVPRGFENHDVFRRSIHQLLNEAVDRVAVGFSDHTDKTKVQSFTTVDGLTPVNHKDATITAKETLKRIVDYAFELRCKNARVALRVQQPKPIDSVFASSPFELLSFTTAVLILSVLTPVSVNCLLRLSNRITILVGLMTCSCVLVTSMLSIVVVAACRKRLDEARSILFTTKWFHLMKGVFCELPWNQQRKVKMNPFNLELSSLLRKLEEHGRMIDTSTEKLIGDFLAVVNPISTWINSSKSYNVELMEMLVTRFIAGAIDVAPFAKDIFVSVIKTLYETQRNLVYSKSGDVCPSLFECIESFHLNYVAKCLQPQMTPQDCLTRWHFTWTEFLAAFHLGFRARQVYRRTRQELLNREVRDLQEIIATYKESCVCGLVICGLSLTLGSNVIATLIFLMELLFPGTIMQNVAVWVAKLLALSFMPLPCLALYVSLPSVCAYCTALKTTLRNVHSKSLLPILVCGVIQGLTRGALILGGCVLLLERKQFELVCVQEHFVVDPSSIVLLLLLSLFTSITTEGEARKLPSNLSLQICLSLDDEIQKIRSSYAKKHVLDTGMDPDQETSRQIWEYTAREFVHRFRFDLVLPPDRFSALFHFLQSGSYCSPSSSFFAQ